jgi:peptide/nickel transport system substrate-binding protein
MDTIYEPGVPAPTRFAQPPLIGYGYTGDGTDLRYWGTDHDQARELMAAAGYPDGFEAEIVYINTPTFEINQRMSELIAEQAAQVGIDLTLKGVDLSLVELQAGEWSIWSTGLPMQADPDGATFWLRESNPNIKCSTPELEELLDAQASEVDPERRREIYHEMMDYIEENAMMLFLLAEPLRVEVWGDDVQDYEPVPHVRRTSLRQTWLDR